MQTITPKDLQSMILVSSRRVAERQEEINKINVFPVPDQDTGSNLAATLAGIGIAIQGKEFNSFSELAQIALEAAMANAQGNAGVIYTGFLAGFLAELSATAVDAQAFSLAFQKGAARAYGAIQNPREGTILDVINAAAGFLVSNSKKESRINEILPGAVAAAKAALDATRAKNDVLRRAGVVDAGGLGFLIILEGYLEASSGQRPMSAAASQRAVIVEKQLPQIASQRFEVAALVESQPGDNLPGEAKVKDILKQWGDSIDVVAIGNRMRVHVHTDRPQEVRQEIGKFGTVSSLRVQDIMANEAGMAERGDARIGIVCEDMADLTQKIIDHYKIAVVPTPVIWPEGEKLSGNLYQKMGEADKLGAAVLPKTSAPSLKNYIDAFNRQLELFDKVLCVAVSSKISGSYNVALQARKMIERPDRVAVIDSGMVAASQALLVLRAIELVRQGWEMDDVVKDLKNFAVSIHGFIAVEDPKWLAAGGRITKTQAFLIRRLKTLGLHQLIEIKEGMLKRGGIVFGRDKVWALAKQIKKSSVLPRSQGRQIRVVIIHADDIENAKKLKHELSSKLGAEVSFINLASPAIGVHGGPGTLMAAWALTC